MPHTFVCPLGVYTPIGPHALLSTCMALEHFHVVGGCYLLKCVLGTAPLHPDAVSGRPVWKEKETLYHLDYTSKP